tara:strand:- start:239 stop:853 length:615 start_codon:yes stop_codon:yes gene_type:complete
MKINKELFITFEGPEASGKSSQIKLLSNFLTKNKIPFIVTREPGGTFVSEKIRKIILDKKNKITQLEEILLLMASRSNHINTKIIPNLKKGKIVISDRFADSTFVYQGYVNKFGILATQELHRKLLKNFLPSKTFLFNLSVSEIINRLRKRKNKNKYDKIDFNFHKKVNMGYKKISQTNRFININGSDSKSNIHKKILKNLKII